MITPSKVPPAKHIVSPTHWLNTQENVPRKYASLLSLHSNIGFYGGIQDFTDAPVNHVVREI